jgi:hypothetical protein
MTNSTTMLTTAEMAAMIVTARFSVIVHARKFLPRHSFITRAHIFALSVSRPRIPLLHQILQLPIRGGRIAGKRAKLAMHAHPPIAPKPGFHTPISQPQNGHGFSFLLIVINLLLHISQGTSRAQPTPFYVH